MKIDKNISNKSRKLFNKLKACTRTNVFKIKISQILVLENIFTVVSSLIKLGKMKMLAFFLNR